jgi:hypothetical protein
LGFGTTPTTKPKSSSDAPASLASYEESSKASSGSWN